MGWGDKPVVERVPNWQQVLTIQGGHACEASGRRGEAGSGNSGCRQITPHPLFVRGRRSEFGCYKDACAQGYLAENSRNILDFAHPGNFIELLRNDYGVSGFHGF